MKPDNRQQSDDVSVVTVTGSPVKSRIPKIDIAYRLYDSIKKQMEAKYRDFASTQGLIDGNPPQRPQAPRTG